MSENGASGRRSEKEIFFEALDKASPAERAAFLDGACGTNPVQRARIEELLADHFQQDAFMKGPAAAALVPRPADSLHSASPSTDTASPMIGRYKLLEKLGEGGFGEVWMAEQREPVKRRVALKIIKLGMDSKQVVARFEAERQALALMDHPNIAKILDAGTTAPHSPIDQPPSAIAPGRPYFVMELVRGVRITDYCDQNQLPTRERLDLFIKVCQAIQHAHQKGIIHRDIKKPSNILVTLRDGVPVPKVIDFGIAKATNQELTDKTLFTQFSHFIGTPAYISPEQVGSGGLDIDTRSDIYSLGVLLYELLVGRTPFDPTEMSKGGLDALRQLIRQKEPLKPSTRLKTLSAEDQTATAKHRRTEPLKLTHQLRGDLDWIVLKCLEKDRTRRYETANELALDLQRHLANEPVLARPPSLVYTLQKTWQRHKLAMIAGIVVTFALAGGTGVSTWQTVQARQSRDAAEAARRAEATQRQAAQAALRMEETERKRAEASEKAAQGLLYVANLNLIRQAWDANNLNRIRQLLDETTASRDRGFEWYYWQRQVHLDQRTFRAHATRVWSASFSPDGLRIVTTSDDGTAKVLEASTGRELLTLPGHNDWVRSASFSPDGTRIVTGSKDYVARVWDATEGVELLRLLGHRTAIRTAEYFPDGRRIVTASQDGTARIWDADTGRQLLELRGHSNWVFSAAASPDGRLVVTAGDDDSARIWNADDGRELLRLTGHAGNVRTAAFSPDGRHVVTASQDQTAKIWDTERGHLRTTLVGHNANVFSAAFSPDGRRIVTTSGDQTIRIWDAENGRELNQLKGHGGDIYTAVYSKSGRQILSASADATAKIWDAASPSTPLSLEHGGSVFALAVAPDSERIATGGTGDRVKVWSATTGKLLLTLPSADAEVRSLAFSPDGQRLAAGHGDGSVDVWLANEGRRRFNFAGHVGVNSIAFSTDGRRLITAGSEGKIKVWAADDGRELLSLPPVSGQTFSARFSPDGARIVSSYLTGAKVWDAHTGAEIFTLIDTPHRVRAVTFSPDGRRILAASEDKTARVWQASNGGLQHTLNGHTHGVFAAGYSPDGKRIVTGSQDFAAKVWDAATGQELLTLSGHKGAISSVAFSPDGQRLVTGSVDGTARVWTAALPEQVATWQQEQLSGSNRLHAPTPLPSLATGPTSLSSPLPPGLITRWLVLAPIRIAALDPSTALAQEQLSNEANLQPRARERVHLPSRDLSWDLMEQNVPLLDFNAFVGQTASPNSVAYAVCYLATDSPQSGVVLRIASDDECKVYLNGRTLHRSNPKRSYVLDEEEVAGVHLPAGTNTLVFKIVNQAEFWRGSIRILDATGQSLPGLRVGLEPAAHR